MTMAPLLQLLIFLLFQHTIHSQSCRWTSGSNTLDLSCIKGRTITASDGQDHTYTYSICENSAGNCGNDDLMAKQVADNDDSMCYEIGRFEEGVTPSYDSAEWTFRYENGQQCSPYLSRSWVPTFVCDSSTELSASTVTEPFGSCQYQITIRTKYACSEVISCSGNSASGLSGGSIFLIVLLCGVIMYCVGGYVFMAMTVNKEGGFKDFGNNIPQRSFWCALPRLVKAGCMVSREVVMYYWKQISKGKGDEADNAHSLDEA